MAHLTLFFIYLKTDKPNLRLGSGLILGFFRFFMLMREFSKGNSVYRPGGYYHAI